LPFLDPSCPFLVLLPYPTLWTRSPTKNVRNLPTFILSYLKHRDTPLIHTHPHGACQFPHVSLLSFTLFFFNVSALFFFKCIFTKFSLIPPIKHKRSPITPHQVTSLFRFSNDHVKPSLTSWLFLLLEWVKKWLPSFLIQRLKSLKKMFSLL